VQVVEVINVKVMAVKRDHNT